jgi:hypothetical protein
MDHERTPVPIPDRRARAPSRLTDVLIAIAITLMAAGFMLGALFTF